MEQETSFTDVELVLLRSAVFIKLNFVINREFNLRNRFLWCVLVVKDSHPFNNLCALYICYRK